MYRIVVFCLWLPIFAGTCALSAGAQTENPLCVTGPSADVTRLSPGAAAGTTVAQVCTSVSTAPLTRCTYQIGASVQTLTDPAAGRQYAVTFPSGVIDRGQTKPFRAQCFSEAGEGEVRVGSATFPHDVPSAPVLLP